MLTYYIMTCLDAIIVILARPTMLCIHLVYNQANTTFILQHHYFLLIFAVLFHEPMETFSSQTAANTTGSTSIHVSLNMNNGTIFQLMGLACEMIIAIFFWNATQK